MGDLRDDELHDRIEGLLADQVGGDDLIAPLFVREGIDEPNEITSLPGVMQHTVDSLRAEAEALRDEYRRKVAGAEKDAEAMLANAQREADAIVAKAEDDSKAMVERRKRMAEDKIAAAEREAVEDVRARAASAAAAAAGKLIAEKHDADADRKLADELIAGI